MDLRIQIYCSRRGDCQRIAAMCSVLATEERPCQEIIVIGHKTPDTDSACAAWSYARFKNTIDPERHYRAAVCGPLGNQAKFVFSNAGVEPPALPERCPAARARYRRNGRTEARLQRSAADGLRDLEEHTISVVPVFEGEDKFAGIIGIHEMTYHFVEGSLTSRPLLTFRAENIQKVLPGRFIKRGAGRIQRAAHDRRHELKTR